MMLRLQFNNRVALSSCNRPGKIYQAEADITPTSLPTAANKEIAAAELKLKYELTIRHAEYEQDPIYDDEKLHNGTLELGVILPSGQAVYDAPVPVKVLFNKLD